jgi:hypothetical protein
LVSFKLEKQQVAALTEYLESVLADLPAPTSPVPSAPELVEPVVAEWTVGGIGIAVDEGSDRILLVIHELVEVAGSSRSGGPGDGADDDEIDQEVAELLAELAGLALDLDGDDGSEGDDDGFDEDGFEEDRFEEDRFEEDQFDEEGEASMARLRLTRDQVAAFVARAAELMEGGRPLCPFCGLPSDPTGHICPRAN